MSVVVKTTIKCDAPDCSASFSLRSSGILIRCIAENKEGWACEDRGGRDFCPEHVHLADPKRIGQPSPTAIGDVA